MTFKMWMDKVDGALDSVCGLSHMDIADQRWHDWFDDGFTPEEAAREALEDEGFPF